MTRILAQSAHTLCLLACGVLLGLSVAGVVLLENPIYYHTHPASGSPGGFVESPKNKWWDFGMFAACAVFFHIMILYVFPLALPKRLKDFGEFWTREENVPLGCDVLLFWYSSGILIAISAFIIKSLDILLLNLAIPFRNEWFFDTSIMMWGGILVVFGGPYLTFWFLTPEREKVYPHGSFRAVEEPEEQEMEARDGPD